MLLGIDWLRGAKLVGGPGMFDAQISRPERTIKATFMECGHLVPMPIEAPIQASNGVAVAHPVDLLAAKLEACISRGAERDYIDLAEAARVWPAFFQATIAALPERPVASIARALVSPPTGVQLQPKYLTALQAVATDLMRLVNDGHDT